MRHNNYDFECGDIFISDRGLCLGVMLSASSFLVISGKGGRIQYTVTMMTEFPKDARPLNDEEIRYLQFETKFALRCVQLIAQKNGITEFRM